MAVAAAAITGNDIAIIAGFAGVADGVAASAGLAIGATGGVGRVGVGWAGVTGFAIAGIWAAISAPWDSAVIATAVVVIGVAVVAGFTARDVDVAVATDLDGGAIGRAAITGNDIAIIAGFAGVADGVAASAGLAIGAAGGVGGVGIRWAGVAVLTVGCIEGAVAASGDTSIGGAGIAAGGVAIIALLADEGIDDAITTGFARVAAGCAAIARGLIAIIAGFAVLDELVAAKRVTAGASLAKACSAKYGARGALGEGGAGGDFVGPSAARGKADATAGQLRSPHGTLAEVRQAASVRHATSSPVTRKWDTPTSKCLRCWDGACVRAE